MVLERGTINANTKARGVGSSCSQRNRNKSPNRWPASSANVGKFNWANLHCICTEGSNMEGERGGNYIAGVADISVTLAAKQQIRGLFFFYVHTSRSLLNDPNLSRFSFVVGSHTFNTWLLGSSMPECVFDVPKNTRYALDLSWERCNSLEKMWAQLRSW